ncbi:hypothetical protein [Necropsobacter rosorum]|uniref:hypothetical protein n=1 Tax=Necropsobacter rosorum TaxID=908285 RepID=UPI00069129FA
MQVDRDLQNHVLHFLKEHYDNFIEERLIYAVCINKTELSNLNEQFSLFPKIKVNETTMKHLRDNLLYLNAHKLLEQQKGTSYRITHKGVDFIEGDGGLSAILNISTVKLHPNTVDLFVQVINQSSLNPDEKQRLSSLVRSLPADATK